MTSNASSQLRMALTMIASRSRFSSAPSTKNTNPIIAAMPANAPCRGLALLLAAPGPGRQGFRRRTLRTQRPLTPPGARSYVAPSPAPGNGAVAQLVERVVRNDEVRGSTPLGSTRHPLDFMTQFTAPDGPASPSAPFRVAAVYRFARIAEREVVRDHLEALCAPDVRGILLVAHEGLNGTIAGPEHAIERVLDGIRALSGFADLDVKFADAWEPPFRRMKVRIKAEIVTMGQPDLDPAQAGTYVSPAEWNALIADPDTIVIDTRNDYEGAVGAFAGAVQPNTRSFRDFPAWFHTEGRALLDR